MGLEPSYSAIAWSLHEKKSNNKQIQCTAEGGTGTLIILQDTLLFYWATLLN